MSYLIIALFGYLLGSIPFGLVLCKIFGLGDIRSIGSGNIGATNVLRTGNKPLALATLLLDSGKGAIAVLCIYFITAKLIPNCTEITEEYIKHNSFIYCYPKNTYEVALPFMMIAGLGAVLGHCYPIWLKFKGGKGVATTLGTLLALVWPVGLAACGIWFISALLFRISSLAALIAVGLTPIISHYLYHDPNLSFTCALIAAIVYIKHRENIKRLFAGEEPKIGKKKK